MRYILGMIAGLCLFGSLQAQPGRGWKQQKLKGKVKTVKTQETYRYKKTGVFTPWEKTYARNYSYDKTGSSTMFEEYGLTGALMYRIEYQYDPKERKTALSYFDKDGKPTTKHTWLFDSKGQWTEEIQYDRDGRQSFRYVYAYDGRGNNTVRSGYKTDGSLSSKTTYTFNDKNQALGYLVETPGYANSSRKFVYDDKGNLAEESWLNGKGEMDFRFVRSYDDQGNMIKEVKYKGASAEPRDTVTWRYEYDKAGNWTKRTQSASDGTDFHIEERTIVYY